MPMDYLIATCLPRNGTTFSTTMELPQPTRETHFAAPFHDSRPLNSRTISFSIASVPTTKASPGIQNRMSLSKKNWTSLLKIPRSGFLAHTTLSSSANTSCLQRSSPRNGSLCPTRRLTNHRVACLPSSHGFLETYFKTATSNPESSRRSSSATGF